MYTENLKRQNKNLYFFTKKNVYNFFRTYVNEIKKLNWQ